MTEMLITLVMMQQVSSALLCEDGDEDEDNDNDDEDGIIINT